MDLDQLNEKFKKGFKRYMMRSILNAPGGIDFINNVSHENLEEILEGLCKSEYFRDYCFDDFEIIYIDMAAGRIDVRPPTVFKNLPSVKLRKK